MQKIVQVVIEIDKELAEKGHWYTDEKMWAVIKAAQNGTFIPDNATNGDVIMAMFPNVNVYEHNGGATYSVNNEYNFNATWWNAPYQKGGK